MLVPARKAPLCVHHRGHLPAATQSARAAGRNSQCRTWPSSVGPTVHSTICPSASSLPLTCFHPSCLPHTWSGLWPPLSVPYCPTPLPASAAHTIPFLLSISMSRSQTFKERFLMKWENYDHSRKQSTVRRPVIVSLRTTQSQDLGSPTHGYVNAICGPWGSERVPAWVGIAAQTIESGQDQSCHFTQICYRSRAW